MSEKHTRRFGWRSIVAAGAFCALVIGWQSGLIPPGSIPVYGALSLFSFLVYRADKSAAAAGQRRIPERTLHFVDLLGGWPGGLLAQERLRHKTRKPSFQVTFWGTVALNCAILAALFFRAA